MTRGKKVIIILAAVLLGVPLLLVLVFVGIFAIFALGGLGIGASESYGNPPEFEFSVDLTPRWTPDGASIVFGHSDGKIYVVSADGMSLRSISGRSGKYNFDISPSISPGGTRMAYATLRHKTGRDREFEIFTSALDGSDKRRLTENQVRDRFPVWSPDGSRIAFASSPSISSASTIIATVYPDGSGVRQVISLGGVVISPPVWSPDGRRIAFVANHQDGPSYAVYVSGIHGSDLTQVRETSKILYTPSWSPDSERIVFAELDEHEFDEERNITRLYTVDHDGSNLRELSSLYTPASYLDTLSWSPDGFAILVESSIFSLGTSSLLTLTGPGGAASWSPDGSRVAINAQGSAEVEIPGHVGADYDDIIFYPQKKPGVVLYTVSRHGSDARVLVEQDGRGDLLAVNARPLDYEQPVTTIYFDESGRPLPEPFDIEQCSNGVVVPNPDDNPGLVRDCKTLLQIRDSLGADPPLNWSTDISIFEWEKVSQQFSYGVAEILLRDRNLTGIISSEFGNLARLRQLDLSNNDLVGEIPSQLGNLARLEQLDLSNNDLVGEIPSQLGNLTSLQELYLSGNELEGEIPAELGNLTELRMLSLDSGQLAGILEVLSMLNLHTLSLRSNSLEDCIPEKIFEMVGTVYHDKHIGPCED